MSRGPVYGSRGTSVQKKQEDGVRALLTTVWEPEERIPVVVTRWTRSHVKNDLQGLTTRLGLRNRVHAVAYALPEGYIS
jgi:hypothetical protein